MVKGISRQVIVVQSPEPKLFEQAIFILREGQKEITDEELLKEARKLMHKRENKKNSLAFTEAVICACGGALLTGLVWLFAVLV